jgi:hypothetical protein
VSALFAGTWVRSGHWHRAATLALGGMLATNSLAMLLHQYWVFVLIQGTTGFFATSIICLAVTILSDRSESARAFGMSNALQVVYQISAMLLGPTLLRLAGLNGVLGVMVAMSALALLLLPLLPDCGRAVVSQGAMKTLLKPATLLGLLGFGMFFVNAGAYWTYVEIMGEAHGMTSRLTANCIAAGVSAGILGGGAAWVLGDRFGNFWPIILSCVLTVGASILLHGDFTVIEFVVSVFLYFFAWNYAVAYQLSIVNEIDATGRGVAITQAFAFLGAGVGAGLAASLVTPGHYQAVIGVAIFAVCLSTGFFAISLTIHKYCT